MAAVIIAHGFTPRIEELCCSLWLCCYISLEQAVNVLCLELYGVLRTSVGHTSPPLG